MDMYEKRVRLRELMAAPECVPVLGAYDLLSAKLIEATGFPVVYTGSFITGASQFFLADVGLVQLKDLLPWPMRSPKRWTSPSSATWTTGGSTPVISGAPS